jgi:hypothetical protein
MVNIPVIVTISITMLKRILRIRRARMGWIAKAGLTVGINTCAIFLAHRVSIYRYINTAEQSSGYSNRNIGHRTIRTDELNAVYYNIFSGTGSDNMNIVRGSNGCLSVGTGQDENYKWIRNRGSGAGSYASRDGRIDPGHKLRIPNSTAYHAHQYQIRYLNGFYGKGSG